MVFCSYFAHSLINDNRLQHLWKFYVWSPLETCKALLCMLKPAFTIFWRFSCLSVVILSKFSAQVTYYLYPNLWSIFKAFSLLDPFRQLMTMFKCSLNGISTPYLALKSLLDNWNASSTSFTANKGLVELSCNCYQCEIARGLCY